MSAPIMITIVLAMLALYGVGFGVTWALLPHKEYSDGVTEFLLSLLWLVTLPGLAGMWLVVRLQGPRIPRAEVRRK